MNKTSIEWTDYTWNPVTGCNKVSQGCKHCYAETMATRFWGDRKFTDVQTHIDRLNEPIKNAHKWAGKKIFVCSMSDLFHESVSFAFIDKVYSKISDADLWGQKITWQILTKRPDRMLEYHKERSHGWMRDGVPNWLDIWHGTSVEDQPNADERIPLLLQVPSSKRFLSCEPLLGPIDFISSQLHPSIYSTDQKINWVIAGGESGHSARPMHPDWVRSLRDQCEAAGVPFFFKQWGAYYPELEETPESNAAVPHFDWSFKKLGKSKSGNLLDGKQHLNFPQR